MCVDPLRESYELRTYPQSPADDRKSKLKPTVGMDQPTTQLLLGHDAREPEI
jgi:hypothetical protein